MKWLRSIIFDFFFYVITPFYLLILWPFAELGSRKLVFKIYKVWAWALFKLLKGIIGLRFRIEGKENLDKALEHGPCLIACQHQSAWETIVFPLIIDNFVIVLKKQLLHIPLFGIYLKKLHSIAIDRSNTASSLKSLLQQSRSVINEKASILIFPQGTRTLSDDIDTFQAGIGVLYRDLKVPVLPVALNSGYFWGRRSLYKKPGEIVLSFLPPIMPGLTREDFMNQLATSISEKSKMIKPNFEQKTKKSLALRILTLSLAFLLGGAFGIHYYFKSKLQQNINECNFHYSSLSSYVGFKNLPSFQLKKVERMLTPYLSVKSEKVKMTPISLTKISINAQGCEFQIKGGGTLFAKHAEAIATFEGKNKLKVNWIQLHDVTLNALDKTYKFKELNGFYQQNKESINFELASKEMIKSPFSIKGNGKIIKINEQASMVTFKGQINLMMNDLFLLSDKAFKAGVLTENQMKVIKSKIKVAEGFKQPHEIETLSLNVDESFYS